MRTNLLTACIVGGGNRSVEHARVMRSRDRLSVAGVFDPAARIAQGWLKDEGVVYFNNLDCMITRARPNFALVSCPHHVHLEAVDCLSANGVHVMKEKPLARTVDEACRLLELCDERGVSMFVTMQRRYSNVYQCFRHSINKVGKPLQFTAEYTLNIDNPAQGWRASKKTAGGGAIIDMGYHMIDLLIWYFGMPSAIVASFEDDGGDSVENEARISFLYDNGMIGELFISREAGPKREQVCLVGEEGTLFADRKTFIHRDTGGAEVERQELPADWSGVLDRQLHDYLSGLGDGSNPTLSASEHVCHAAFVEACYASKSACTAIDPTSLLPGRKNLFNQIQNQN